MKWKLSAAVFVLTLLGCQAAACPWHEAGSDEHVVIGAPVRFSPFPELPLIDRWTRPPEPQADARAPDAALEEEGSASRAGDGVMTSAARSDQPGAPNLEMTRRGIR